MRTIGFACHFTVSGFIMVVKESSSSPSKKYSLGHNYILPELLEYSYSTPIEQARNQFDQSIIITSNNKLFNSKDVVSHLRGPPLRRLV